MVGTTGNEYNVWYNYGNKGRGQRVYRCITHRECGKLFRVAFAEDGDGEVTTLEETGEHAEILSGGWKIGDNAKLLEWVAGKRCETTDSFFGVGLSFDPVADATSFASHTHSFQHDLIVLKAFEYTTEEESGTKVSSYGIIATSRACFRNVVYAVRGQGDDGVLGVTDGTYELHFGGWTLIDFENMLVYKEMFSTVKHFALKFFGITLQLAFGSLDHTSYIANAFKAEWPDILLLDCYAHFVRKARAKTKLLQNDKFFDTDVWPDIKYLHEARSKEQFIALVPVRLTQAHFCEGPLLSEIITKTKLLLGSSENYYSLRITKRKVLKSILFNASKYVVDGRNVHGNKVTRDRVHRFLNSVRGDLQPTPTVHEVELLFLSLHKVELLHLRPLGLSGKSPIPTNEIIGIRQKYRCDCLGFWKNGWQLSGGQKKNRGALCQDRSSQNFFSVNNLVTLFLRFPARPLHWNVLQEIEGADGHAETRAGVVMTWAERDGVFVWTIKLSDGQSLVLKCEDLAEAVNRAYVLGLDVTTSIKL
ncbi:hypothetical protein PF011_g8712 [Phytophthora fragariae]|uniref:MULE transposase domain-containing protein n=1 Tax=Phytophthora fragariae TaxID=53985 RepID=A0A6A3L4B0_9STRA|nr:hypothetical protein PF011_g8712 [Phytophthora fragariae]